MPTVPAHRSGSTVAGRRAGRRGQATTEWMLMISMIAVALVAAFFGLALIFRGSMGGLGMGVAEIYTTGDLAR